MNAKEYLSQVKSLKIGIKSKARQIQSLEDSLYKVSPILCDMPKAATPQVDRMAGLVAAKVDLERELEADSTKLAEISQTINSLTDPQYRSLLTNRYFAMMEWNEIADEMYLSTRSVYRLHKEALGEFEKSAVGGSW